MPDRSPCRWCGAADPVLVMLDPEASERRCGCCGEPADGRESYIPSPEEIAAECERIRAGWSDAEKLDRMVGPRAIAWSVPQVRMAWAGDD